MSLEKREPFRYEAKIRSENVANKFGDVINVVLHGANAATAGNYSTFYNVPNAMEIILISRSYTTPSTSGTLQLEKLTGTQAPGAGVAILSTTLALSGISTENIVVTRTQREMTSARVFKEGDRIALIDGGDLTNLADLVMTIYYKPLGRGDYR